MKPHPRIRKTIKWTKWCGLMGTVLLVAVWIASEYWNLRWDRPGGEVVAIWCGRVHVYKWASVIPPHLRFMPRDPPLTQIQFHATSGSAGSFVYIPLWILLPPLLLTTALAALIDAIAPGRIGFCPKCRYDRAGLAKGAVCPECGGMPVKG